MSDFLDLLESVRADEVSIDRMFGDAGRGMRSMRREDPRYQRSLAEAAKLYADVCEGRRPMYRLQEAMSTSDFPLLFGDIIDRAMLGKYREWPSVWEQIARRGTVRDFRKTRKFTMDGAEAVLPLVGQGSEYSEATLTEGKYDYAVSKYGRRVPLLWEIFVNDDLDALRGIPDSLAKAARMTEERFAAEVYADTTGYDLTFFSTANKNIINPTTLGGGSTTNPPLSVTAVQQGLQVLWSQKDADGNPIFAGQVRLVVPPALAVVAKNILNATELRAAAGGGVGTAGDQLQTSNWMSGEIANVVVNPWLPIISTTNGNTTWYLFSDPGVGRPAMEVGFLRGHETPELFLKSPNAIRIGGGLVGAEEGSFETDGIDYKVRHVFGGTLLDPKAVVASNGSSA